MSWHISRALMEAYANSRSSLEPVAEYLVANFSAGAPFAQSSGSPTPQAYLCSDRMTAFSRLSRFGMTFAHLTDTLGADLLTWFRAGFHARTFQLPERAQESTGRDLECGRTWHESLARYDRATSSWRTAQCSLLEGLDEYSETWPRWGIMRDGECSAQSMPAHLTRENESGLSGVPTPRCTNHQKNSRDKYVSLAVWVKERQQWPTPTVCGNYNRKGASKTSGDGLATAVAMFPTPSASHCETRPAATWNTASQSGRSLGATARHSMWPTPCANEDSYRLHGSSQQSKGLGALARREAITAGTGGQLSADWVEWLMGWPAPGWTDLKPLETGKFQQWLDSHGKL